MPRTVMPARSIGEASAGAEPAASMPGAAARVQWLDVAKGAGIVLVVVGHALGGIIDARPGEHLPAFRTLFLAIYTFHMPLFFLLAGLLVRRRLERSRAAFARDMIFSIVLPYLLWSTIQITVIYLAGSLVNRPVGNVWNTLAGIWLHPVSQFWFLYVLLVLHLAAFAVLSRFNAYVLLGLALLARVTFPMFMPQGMLRLAAVHAPFYALGVLLALKGVESTVLAHNRTFRAAILPAAAVVAIILVVLAVAWLRPAATAAMLSPQIAATAWSVAVSPAALVIVAAVLASADRVRGQTARALAFLGRRTMPIFVLHILFIAGTRILATRLGHLHDPWLMLLLVVPAGLIGSLVVQHLAARLGIARPLGLG